jgi:hypothetical protein
MIEMAADQVAYASNYLQSIESVLYSGRRLRGVLDEGHATREDAATQLEHAAEQHTTGRAGYHAFMFSALEAAPGPQQPLRERVTEDVLASVVTDLQVANVLLAAGQATGETDQPGDSRLLDEALLRLESTAQTVNQAIGSPLEGGAVPGRFGFAAAAPQTIQSPDLPAAIQTFHQQANETLDALVSEAQGAVRGVIDALSKVDTDKVIEALGTFGQQMRELPRVGRLIRQGVAALEAAIAGLVNLMGSAALAGVRDRIERLWQQVKDGQYLSQGLTWAFDVEATRTRITEILRSSQLGHAAVDAASNDLTKLRTNFRETMELARGAVAAVTLAGTVLALTPLVGLGLALAVASTYLVILASVILLGMDYADSGLVLRRVRGVGEIASSLHS